ncbi:hypothetical protein IGI37_002072 [Enterococcus sp. AZ194]|uniref:phage tail spike protein n=1 Tax=Enterococcus sp. AZ194 TaxID=2774629 RepID=UPI003F1EB800
MTPIIYEPRETDFAHNGLGFLADTTRCDVTEEANGKYELELEYPLMSRFSDYFENGYQIKAKPNDQEEYHVFEIKNTYKDTINNSILIYAQSRTYKLGNREVQYVKIDSSNGTEAMSAITNGMDEGSDIKLYSDITTTSSTTFEARNVLNCIVGEQGSLLQYWGGEIKREPFKLSLLRRRGRDNLGTVRYGKDLQGLKIKIDYESITTKVLPYADLQSEGDGTTKRIYGSPVLSDLVKNYPDVRARHIQFTEEQGVKDLASLNKVASKYFKSINPGSDKPKISIELEIEKLTDSEEAKEFAKIKNYGLFDTFSVYHSLYDIEIDTKITSVVYDSLNEKNKQITAGDARIAFYQQQNYELQETIKTLTKKGYMSEFVDYVTNLINGVEGGSVLQYPKNKPHTTYYMDTDSRDTAKDVIAINNKGIGFSQTGWLGPFLNAWSIDGILNADFIRTGLIRADILETSFNGMGDILRMVSGTLQAWNKNKKIMELTKRGMEFWSTTGEQIGTMGTTDSIGNPFPDAMTSEPIEDNSVVIRGNDKFVLLSPTEGKGLIMLPKGGSIHLGDLNIQGTLRVDGKPVIPGQGGGPGGGGGTGTGGYPPELTTDTEKWAWDLWAFLTANGYTKQAAAGILGNASRETGGTMNPDTDQVGGPAYGIVQWDGSAYPLIGSPTYDGREYVQRLMAAAGIKADYKTMGAQARLLEWTMFNGQWIGAVDPLTVAGFKITSDISTATLAFLKNYERAGVEELGQRVEAANYWYNRFKDLKPSTETGEAGLKHLETLVGQRIGNGECYGLSAEYSGFLGGCGMGAGTQYALSHVIGDTSAASDIGIAYDWQAVGWKVIQNPSKDQLVVGALINWSKGGRVGSWNADNYYGHTGVIRGLDNGKIQTYEQNTELGRIAGKLEREYYSSSDISSIVIPPK